MRNRNRSRKVWPNEKEYEVAGMLLYLPRLLSCCWPTFGIALLLSTSSWGSKRKRSVIDYDKEVAVVNNKIPATSPLTRAVTASHSPGHTFSKQRPNYVCKIKTTKKALSKKIDKLTQCNVTLTREIGVIRKYYNKLLIKNSILKDMRQQQAKKCYIEEGKTKIVTKGLMNGATDAATVVPTQQDMSFMYRTTQGCQALSPKASDPFGGNSGQNMSRNGLAIGGAMDRSSWPSAHELEEKIGVGQVNKCQATEARRRKMIKIKKW